MYQYVNSAPPAVKKQLGIATTRIGGGVALSVRNDATGYWSKALGFGFDEPVTEAPPRSDRGVLPPGKQHWGCNPDAPSALPSNWEEVGAEYGIALDSAWIKLSCPIEEFAPAGPACGSGACIPTRRPNGHRSRCGGSGCRKRDLRT